VAIGETLRLPRGGKSLSLILLKRNQKRVSPGIHEIPPKYFSNLLKVISESGFTKLATCVILDRSSAKNSCIHGLTPFLPLSPFKAPKFLTVYNSQTQPLLYKKKLRVKRIPPQKIRLAIRLFNAFLMELNFLYATVDRMWVWFISSSSMLSSSRLFIFCLKISRLRFCIVPK